MDRLHRLPVVSSFAERTIIQTADFHLPCISLRETLRYSPTLESAIIAQTFLRLKISCCTHSHEQRAARHEVECKDARVDRAPQCLAEYGGWWKRGEDPVHRPTHQGMSLYVLAAGEQLATDVAAEGAHARVDDQVPLERAPVLGDVVTVGALELIEGQVRGLAWRETERDTRLDLVTSKRSENNYGLVFEGSWLRVTSINWKIERDSDRKSYNCIYRSFNERGVCQEPISCLSDQWVIMRQPLERIRNHKLMHHKKLL